MHDVVSRSNHVLLAGCEKSAVSPVGPFNRRRRRLIVLTPTQLRWHTSDDTATVPRGTLDLSAGVAIDQPEPTKLRVSAGGKNMTLTSYEVDAAVAISTLRSLLEERNAAAARAVPLDDAELLSLLSMCCEDVYGAACPPSLSAQPIVLYLR